MMSVQNVIIVIFIAGAVTFFTRVVPFLFFAGRQPSAAVMYLQKYLPPAVMLILVVYSLKDVAWADASGAIPAIIGVSATVILHAWRGNPLISIFGATALFMAISRFMA